MTDAKPAFLVALLLLFCLGSCGRGSHTPRQTPWGELNPRPGGMVLPSATPALPAGSQAPLTAPALQVGQVVVATGNSALRLYADASANAAVMEVYPSGTLFTVVEPSGTYVTYPVQNEGHRWYRLQAVDGLVGWALIEAIVVD